MARRAGRGRGRKVPEEAPEARPEAAGAPPVCPLCERPITPGSRSSLHHLATRLRGGRDLRTVRLHQICHDAIHARFSEAELARRLDEVEALRAEPALAGFLAWVADKPPEFHARTRMSGERKGARRR